MSPMLSINPNFLIVSPSCLKCSKYHCIVHHCAQIAVRVCSFRSKIICLQSMNKRVNQTSQMRQLNLMVLSIVLIQTNGYPSVG